MPSTKKASANWYIATTHYLTGGFLVPLIGGLILEAIITNALQIPGGLVHNIGNDVISAILVFLGVLYSARYVNRTYVVRNSSAVVNLATSYMFVINVLIYTGFGIYITGGQADPVLLTLSIFSGLLNLGIFYMASKKYIVATG